MLRQCPRFDGDADASRRPDPRPRGAASEVLPMSYGGPADPVLARPETPEPGARL